MTDQYGWCVVCGARAVAITAFRQSQLAGECFMCHQRASKWTFIHVLLNKVPKNLQVTVRCPFMAQYKGPVEPGKLISESTGYKAWFSSHGTERCNGQISFKIADLNEVTLPADITVDRVARNVRPSLTGQCPECRGRYTWESLARANGTREALLALLPERVEWLANA